MTSRALALIACLVCAVILICGGLTGMLLTHGAAASCAPTAGATPQPDTSLTAPSGTFPAIGRWDSTQIGNAAAVITVGATRHLPARAWVIATATAMQESSLRNIHYGDRDSVGLFQQRPSQGWGSVEQLMDPAYTAGKFYDKLVTIDSWQTLPLTEAAQAVQISATPDAYAQWEPDAVTIVQTVVSSENRARSVMSLDLEQCPNSCPEIVSSPGPQGSDAGPSGDAARCEWVTPVHAPIVSGFRTAERPGHDGVDLGAARGTPIHVASSGTVVVVRCNVVPASHGCDQDGSPSTPGCGWYVDVRHTGNVVTRYCHMLTRPTVVEGQQVLAGQVIGKVGSSGHSSGPHLHFEVHVNGDRGPSGAVDPVSFMHAKGVRLGSQQ
ncbi:M23 family metallopeptidase [Dactylosporangium sp. NPDC005572]|uniref:M23 family metallopeptidase n=1 Tax=Dactylosporangium sp. NPDC005572 TaxID=3156889 RepID=UPI0033A8F780